MSQWSLNPKIRFVGQKVCPVARGQTATKVTTVGTLSGFQEFFLQPIIKDRPNNYHPPPKKKKRLKENSILGKQMWDDTLLDFQELFLQHTVEERSNNVGYFSFNNRCEGMSFNKPYV